MINISGQTGHQEIGPLGMHAGAVRRRDYPMNHFVRTHNGRSGTYTLECFDSWIGD